jgi:hypothetical protein
MIRKHDDGREREPCIGAVLSSDRCAPEAALDRAGAGQLDRE